MNLLGKKILYKMIFDQLLETTKIPRGNSKSAAMLFMQIHVAAVRKTNYCLAAIGETYDPGIFEDLGGLDNGRRKEM